MGFSALLQGKSSHEALVSLQDAEIRLLENMKRCISLRIKCDREYAIALNTMCMQAQKSEKTDELSGSLIAKSWKVIIQETEAMSRLVKSNADQMSSTTIEKLNYLINEKRNAKKQYTEEHSRIESELMQLQDAVMKAKNEYEKSLETFKLTKIKYEELNVRGKGSKKLEDIKDKYLKACRKLHLAHNQYVLLLCEASEYERDFRTILLPGILEFQQNLQEEMVDHWKMILSEFVQHTDFTNERFQQFQDHIITNIEGITPVAEYREFVDKYKSPPPLPIAFIFDRKFIDDYNSQLKPNAVTVDDLTFTILRVRLMELSEKLQECQILLKEKQNQLIQCENEISSLRKTADMAATIFVKKKLLETLRQEINDLKSREHRYQKQHDLIFGPFSGLGETGPPNALDIKDDADGDHNEHDTTLDKIQSHTFVKMLCKPFSKRQTQIVINPPVLPDKDFMEEVTTQNSADIIMAADGTKLALNTERPLYDEDWFHGVLPREEVVRLLVNDGDYLVRETMRNEERQVVLSVRWQGHKHFIIQITSENQYRFEGPAFPTIQELIFYQHRSNLPVTNKSGAVLKNPILRERWELNNDDVELLTKIGRGNFGDVYRARLKSTNEELAVKTCHMTLPEEQKKKFLQEGRILKQYDHPNIVKLIGICVQKQPIMIVMELVPGGSLLNFLRNHGVTLSVNEKIKMCTDCAAGMEYLESKNCIHRDLAARNCLIGHENIVKISDFGMSREEEEYTVSNGMKQIPIKWTAPEALNFGKYTSLCDVWSYSILVWEVFSNGSTPYSGLSNTKAREMIDSGYRMPAPDGTPAPVYKLMLHCWEYEPENRPHFNEILECLQVISSNISRSSSADALQ